MNRIGKRYRTGRATHQYDTIIIGSGLGGLTCAALLSKMGQKVCVLEQHYTAGGFTHSYENQGYEWDVGIHYVGEVHKSHSIFRKLFDFISNKELKWAHTGEIYDRAIIGNLQFAFERGENKQKQSLKNMFPEEQHQIEKFYKLVNRINQCTPIIFMNKLLPTALAPFYKSLKKVVVPKEAYMTTQKVLESITSNKALQAILATQWGDYGTPPHESPFFMHALLIKSFFSGANVPVGGSWKVADTIIPNIRATGGEVFTYARVQKVLINADDRAIGVEMDNGDCIYATNIVSNCDVRTTFTKLVPEHISQKIGYISKLDQTKPSSAYLNLFAGFKASDEALGLPKENFWIFPSTDHEANINNFIQDTNAPFPAFFISFGSAKDPEWETNYPGKSTLQVIVPGAFPQFDQWENTIWGKRGESYDTFKQQLTDRVLEVVYTHLPQLRGKVDFCELATPLSVKWFQNNQLGEIYGIDHSVERFERNWFTAKTPIKNFYLTGQDTLMVGIAGGALLSGLITALHILGTIPSLKLLRKLFR